MGFLFLLLLYSIDHPSSHYIAASGQKMNGQILGLGGSLRPGSMTLTALKIALAGAEEAGAEVNLIDLAMLDLPLFKGETNLEDYTAAQKNVITTLLDNVAAADGIILASPTYHNTISGAVKNALDFLEFLNSEEKSVFTGKVVGIVAVQGGTSGTGINTLTTMLFACRALGAWVAPTMVSVPGSRDAFQEKGHARDPQIQARLRKLGAEVALMALRLN